jgi:hypothetical protein
VQFHPEKSSAAGGRIIANFVRLATAIVGDISEAEGEGS